MNRQFSVRKRILSKPQYIVHLGKRMTLAPFGCLLCLIGCVGLFLALCLSILLVCAGLSLLFYHKSDGLGFWLVSTLLVGSLSLEALWTGLKAIEAFTEMKPAAPFTRQNVEQLPEPESLVRASAEPPAEQSDVLLRAAQHGQRTPAEELLRAHENGTVL
jgi:hypothetical protein